MSERVKKLIENAREAFKATYQDAHGFTLPGYTSGAHFFAVLDVLSAEVDALSRGLETLTRSAPEPADTLDWKRKYEAFQEVHNEVHTTLAKAGPDIHDLANKGHAYAIEVLIAQRDLARRERDAAYKRLDALRDALAGEEP